MRLLSLDVYRGLVMLLLAFAAGHWDWMRPIQEAHSESPRLVQMLGQFDHVEWQGLVLWDMIQPSFMFMVGVSMAYSYASRQKRGDSYSQMLGHAVCRAAVLVLLGVFLRSLWSESTNWTFEDVVSQIGLGYVALFLLWGRPAWVQVAAAAIILTAYYLLFALWPLPGADYDYAKFQAHAYFDGFFAHWNKNTNPAHAFDFWLLNLFPRETPFTGNPGGYCTLNFVPSLATMIVGLVAGEVLRAPTTQGRQLITLGLSGIGLVLAGVLLEALGVCPIVKPIWTPAFGLVSTGLCLMNLAALFCVVDIIGWRRWAWPAVVVGRNSIAMYCMTYLFAGWFLRAWRTHLGQDAFALFGHAYQPLLETTLVGVCLWLICLWMDRNRIFLRV